MILKKDGVNLMETAGKTPSAVQVVPDVPKEIKVEDNPETKITIILSKEMAKRLDNIDVSFKDGSVF